MSYFKAKLHQIRFPRWGSLQHSPVHHTRSWISGVYTLKGKERREGDGEKGSTFHNLSKTTPVAGYGPEILLDSAN